MASCAKGLSTVDKPVSANQERTSKHTKRNVLPQKLLDNVSSAVKAKVKAGEKINVESASDEESVFDVSALFSKKFDRSFRQHEKHLKKNKKRKKETNSEGKNGKKKKSRPNYFVSLQITNKEIHSKAKDVQLSIVEVEEGMAKFAVPVPKLHLTLAVFCLETDDSKENAKQALHHIRNQLTGDSIKHITVTVSGLGSFRNQVLYASLPDEEQIEQLKHIAELTREEFTKQNIPPTDNRFTPHLTLFKLSRSRKKGGIKRIDPEWYEHALSEHFGTDHIHSIQLCSMRGVDESGYYKVYYQLPFNESQPVNTAIDTAQDTSQNTSPDTPEETSQDTLQIEKSHPNKLTEETSQQDTLPSQATSLKDSSHHNKLAESSSQATVSSMASMTSQPVATAASLGWLPTGPTHFIALQITNPQIHAAARDIQSRVISRDSRMSACATSVDKLHFTVMVMRLHDEQHLQRAKEAVDALRDQLRSEGTRQIHVDVRGLSSFRNKVLYADIPDQAQCGLLNHVADLTREIFTKHGVKPFDNRFTPHITLFKLSQQEKYVLRSIDKQWYSDVSQNTLGSDIITDIQLCQRHADGSEGYYHIAHVASL